MLTINKIFPQEKIPEKTESFLFFGGYFYGDGG